MSNLTYLNDASVLHNLKQRYYAKLIYVRLFHPGKKKRKRFPVSFFFRVSSKPFHCKSRRIRGSAVHERKRWTKTPHWRVTTFFSSFNKIHSMRIACPFEKLRFSFKQNFCVVLQNTYTCDDASFFFSLLSFSFSRKNWKQSPSSDYPLYDRFLIVPKQEGTSLMEFWNSRIRTRDISFFLPPFTNAQYHRKIDDDDDEKPRHLETTISILLFSFSLCELKN